MNKHTLLTWAWLIIVGFMALPVYAQDDPNSLKVVFYNVENLFDTKDNPEKRDDEFMPDGAKKWTDDRYQTKLNGIAKVLAAVGDKELPELIGLCEVENETVLKDLINTTGLVNGKYKIVHEESPDVRGIDCALLYRPDDFTYVSHQAIKVDFQDEPDYKSRDILYVQGKVKGEMLHIFVNHWKSRSGGEEKSEPKRIDCANTVRNKVDEIMKADPKAKIIIMGDLNDYPTNHSVAMTLGATNHRTDVSKTGLYNMMFDQFVYQGLGSHNYQGHWGMLDQMIVSYSLLNSESGLSVGFEDAHPFKQEWMLYYNKKFDYHAPNKTYGGNNYYGGYSDHLPVYMEMKVK